MTSRGVSPQHPLLGADLRHTPDGYTLRLRRRSGAFTVLDGGQPRRWRDLDRAIAYLIAHYGAVSPIRVRLDDDC